jgi:hypothetical protein
MGCQVGCRVPLRPGIWELGFDPKIDAMLRQADNRKSCPDDA